MKKRILSLLLAIIMLFSLLPVSAFATTPEQLVDTTLYWGYNESSKTLYLSKTAEAITGATPGSFVSTVYYYITQFDGENPLPWQDSGLNESVEYVEILNDIAPGKTAYWFYKMFELKEIKGIEHLNTANVTRMDYMFFNCNKLAELDVSKFDTSNVENMTCMFDYCSSLTSLDVSKFDTSKVTNMNEMFGTCELLESLDVSKFDTSSVTDMSFLFSGCKKLTSLDLRKFDTSAVTSMGEMFQSCAALTSLDLSSFDTSKVTSINLMFSGCTALTTLDLSGFDLTNVDSVKWGVFNNAKITQIKTPINVKIDVKLPTLAEPMKWYNADTLEVYADTSLPKEQANSITLVAGVPVDDWGALQTAINETAGDATTSATEPTNFILKNDLTAPATGATSITIPDGKDITIDLNGYVLNANGGAFSVITVNGGKLTVIDSNTYGLTHKFTVGQDGLWTLNESDNRTATPLESLTAAPAAGAYIEVTGGVITGGRANDEYPEGGGVFIDSTDAKSTFTMNGGTVCGNTARWGGGVYVCASDDVTTFNMNGGTICGNTAEWGGGVFITGVKGSSTVATFNMNGGTICDNTAEYGGGVLTIKSTSSYLGGTTVIKDNYAGQKASNLVIYDGSNIIFLGTKTGSAKGNGVLKPADGMVVGVSLVKMDVVEDDKMVFYPTSGKIKAREMKSEDLKYFFSDSADYYLACAGEDTTKPIDDYLLLKDYFYDITDGTAQDANGSIEINKTSAIKGDTVTVTVKPNEGYRLKSLNYVHTLSAWSVIGDFTDWNTGDIPMAETETNVFVSPVLALSEGALFKVRKDAAWTENYGGPTPHGQTPYAATIGDAISAAPEGENIAVPSTGSYIVTLNLNDSATITLTSASTSVADPVTITKDANDAYTFKMPAYPVTVTAEFEASAPTGNEKELFNPQNASVDHTYGAYENPVATWDKATETLTVEIKQQGDSQWTNQVYLNTGITTLDTTKEYQVSFTATASTDDCGGVTFKAFDNNQIAFANQNLPLKTTPYNYVSEWTTPSSASANGMIVFDFGWDPAQTVTITNISIKERTPDSETAKILAALSGNGEQGSIEGVLEVKDDESTGFRTVKLLEDVNLGAANVTVAEGVFLDLNHFNLTTTGTVTNNGTIILHQENAGVIDYLLYNVPGNYGTSEELKLPTDQNPDYVIPANTFMTAEVGTNPAYQKLGFASGDDMLVWNKDVPAGMQLDVMYSLKLGGNILSAKTASIKDTNVTAVNFALNDNISIGSNTETDGAAVLNVTSIYDELFGNTIATFAANGKTITLNKTGKLVISSDATGFAESVLVSGVPGMSIQKKENKAAKTVTYSIAVPSPALNDKTATTITITAVEGLEYSIDDGAAWVSDGGQGDGDSANGTITFAALNANTPYTIIARVQATGESSTASVITTKSTEQSAAAAEPVDVSGGEIKSGDTVVEITTTTGIELPDTALNEVAAQINNVLNNEKVKDFGKVEENDDTGIIAATEASNSKIVDALKDETTDSTAKAAVTDTGISKYLNVTLVSAEVNAGIEVTVTAMTFDVTPMATITVTGSTGSVTLTTEITNNEIGDTVTFLLPVGSSNTAKTAAVYHEDEFLGNFEVKTDVSGKYIEVTTNSFSKFGYITLDENTAGAKIGDTLYASLSDAVSKVANDQTITLLKDASGTITVSRAVKFAVNANDKTNTAEIKAGSGYTVSKSGDTYTISAYSGGGGGASSYAVELPANVKNGKVEVSPKNASAGQTVTLTVTPDKGFTLETLTVLDKNGKEIEVKNLGENKYSFKMPSGKVSISATFMEDNTMLNFFVDVKATDYFYDAVLWAAENGITKGTDDVHFSPDMGTTRAQVVTFLWRAAGCPVVNYWMRMDDVKDGEYYSEAVRWALSEGITKGTSETTFSPDAVCTRGQIVTFLARFAGVEDDASGYSHGFTDVKAMDYYNNAVAWAKDNKVTEGTSATTFSPNTDCTRAQVVTFLYRWMVK